MTAAAASKAADALFDAAVRCVTEWRTRLAFDDWQIDVIRNDDEDGTANVVARPEYRSMQLRVNAAEMYAREFTPLHVESEMLHELVHAKLWIAFNVLVDAKVSERVVTLHEELMTEEITTALLQLKYPDNSAVQQLWRQLRIRKHDVATESELLRRRNNAVSGMWPIQ